MCGIAGYVDTSTPSRVREAAVNRMCDAMVPRGPDDAGVENFSACTLGMRRLAIFDPANGHQPMSTPDRRFRLVFNGAIYNFRELQRDLTSRGHVFRTQCDTEVLLAAFAQWGPKCVTKLRGMYAFAAWDEQDQSLFLARDPFGIKPLYFHLEAGRLLFASELRALLTSDAFRPQIDPVAIADYLAWLAVPAPRTIYRDIRSLRPGESATFRRGDLQIESTWTFRSVERGSICKTRGEFDATLRAQLEETIRAHAIADVPVGAFLSGGLDSAAIVGLMTRTVGARIKTFSIGFAETAMDESTAAERTARHFGTEHHTHVLTGAQVAADLPSLLEAFDQPTGDGINTFYASQAARAGGLTVALSGLGGDELLGGYPSFRHVPRLQRWMPLWRVTPAVVRQRVLKDLRTRGARHRKLADILEHARSTHELCSMHRRVFPESARHTLLSGEVQAALHDSDRLHPETCHLAAELEGAGVFEIVSAWELRTYMADVLLRDSDVMSMRHSLELRVPFVDRPFVEWLWRQPARFKDDRSHPKSALIRALADVLPKDAGRGPKRGFNLPFAHWMRRELKPFLEDTFSAANIAETGLFAPEPVSHIWKSYLAENDTRQWSRVWSLAVLINYVNRRQPSPVRRSTPIVEISTSLQGVRSISERTPTRARAMARNRTLLLAPELFESEGGIPRILQTYLKALCELAGPQDSVRFVALNDQTVDSRDLRRSASERLTDWQVCGRNKRRFIEAAVRLSRGADRVICGHVHQLPVALLAKSLSPSLRYYLVAHGIEVWSNFSLPQRLALRRAEKILCVSEFTRQELLRRCPMRPGRAVVLPNALDPTFAIAPGAPRDPARPVILVVSRLTQADRYKGVEHMVEAMPRIRAALPAATLRIIGRGDDSARLRALRDSLGLEKAVEFLGYVDDRKMAQELRSCSLFALPSKKEGFGLVFLEAMANGRPCLGVRAGGVPEVISPDSGVLVEYGDVPAIARACVDALAHNWDEDAILDRARRFSFGPFTEQLAAAIDLPCPASVIAAS